MNDMSQRNDFVVGQPAPPTDDRVLPELVHRPSVPPDAQDHEQREGEVLMTPASGRLALPAAVAALRGPHA